METSRLHPKIKGKLLSSFHGLQIYGNLKVAKSTGKNRAWIQIRQEEPKRYRVAICLSYPRALDVQFEETIRRFPRRAGKD